MSGVAAFSENALYIMILSAPFFSLFFNLTVYIIKNPGVEFKLLFSYRDSSNLLILFHSATLCRL